MYQLTIVLPCYNPVLGWEKQVLEGYDAVVTHLGFKPELIVVNDGSSNNIDESAIDFLKKAIADFRFESYSINRGKGAALRYGIKKATGTKIIFTDIDFPYTAQSFFQVWGKLEQDSDIVIGIKDASYYKHVPPVRKRISKSLRKLSQLFLNIPVTDTQCGLKGFNNVGKAIFLSTTIDRYLCDLEFVYKGYQHKPKLNIETQEIRLKDNIVFRKMNNKILLTEGFNFLKILLKINK